MGDGPVTGDDALSKHGLGARARRHSQSNEDGLGGRMSWKNVGDGECSPGGSCVLGVLGGGVMNGLPNMAPCFSSPLMTCSDMAGPRTFL